MARIRSVHPEQWNDEEFCSLSMAARLLALGMRNFTDDNGAFEWKPLRMKMRVFPADAIDVEPLISELEASGVIMRYEVGGTTYGLVRNFRRFQRPKKPTGYYPAPNQWGNSSELWAFIGATSTGAVPYWYGSAPEKVPNKYGNLPAEGVGVGVGVGVGEKKKHVASSATRANSPKEDPEGFPEFWEGYPRKAGRKAAVKAWTKLKPSPELRAKMLAALAVQIGSRDWQESAGRYIPHAATWLNNERWLDVVGPSKVNPGQSVGVDAWGYHIDAHGNRTGTRGVVA